MAEPTPGPWRLEMPLADGNAIRIVRGPGHLVAYVESGRADARLMAAAPELLEAVQTMVALLDCGGVITGNNAADLAEARLRAALAKAEGRS